MRLFATSDCRLSSESFIDRILAHLNRPAMLLLLLLLLFFFSFFAVGDLRDLGVMKFITPILA